MSETRAFRELAAVYRERPIVLFTGAGATLTDPGLDEDYRYGVGTWTELLDRAIEGRVDAGLRRRYANLKTAEPWELAEWVSDRLGPARLRQRVVDAVRGPRDRKGKHRNLPLTGTAERPIKQVAREFLDAAPTMNAVVAFCADLAAVTGARDEQGSYIGFRVEPNRRVRAVVTPNFDPYLEAAASRMFKRDLLKPVAAVDSSAGSLRQIPVHHVHGYVSFADREARRRRRSLVLTKTDYKREWKSADGYSPTLGPQVHFLRHYPTLFIGFSFRDRWIAELLTKIHRERAAAGHPRHYAIVREDEFEGRFRELREELGVEPVPVGRFDEIPGRLGKLYVAGLRKDFRRVLLADETRPAAGADPGPSTRRTTYSAEDCWRILVAMRDGKLPRGRPPGPVEYWDEPAPAETRNG